MAWWDEEIQINPQTMGQLDPKFGRYRPIQRPIISTPAQPTADSAIKDALGQAVTKIEQYAEPLTRSRMPDVDAALSEETGGLSPWLADTSILGMAGMAPGMRALKPLAKLLKVEGKGLRFGTEALKDVEKALKVGMESKADWSPLTQNLDAFNNDPEAMHRFARLFGATSPNTSVGQNTREALAVQKALLEGRDKFTQKQAGNLGLTNTGAKWQNLNRAIKGEPLASRQGQPGKVEAFSNLLAGQPNTYDSPVIPIDVHALSGIGASEPDITKAIKGVRGLMKESGLPSRGYSPIYNAAADAYTQALGEVAPGLDAGITFPPFWEGVRLGKGYGESPGLKSFLTEQGLLVPGGMMDPEKLATAYENFDPSSIASHLPNVRKSQIAVPDLQQALFQGVDDTARNINNGAVIQDILKARDAGGGGFTFNRGRGDMAGSDMYAVAIDPRRTAKLSGAANEDEIRAFLEKNKALLNHPDLNLGGWVPTEGPGALDVSYLTPDRALAEQLGKYLDQTAIGHLSKEGYQEIPTGGTGGDLADIEKAYDLLPSELQKLLGHKNFKTPYGNVGPEFLGPESTFADPENVKRKIDQLRAQGEKLGGHYAEAIRIALGGPADNPSGLNPTAIRWAHANSIGFRPPRSGTGNQLHGGAWIPQTSPMMNARGDVYINPELKTVEDVLYALEHEGRHIDDDIVKRYLAAQRGETDPLTQGQIPLLKDFGEERKLYESDFDTPTERNVRTNQELMGIQPPAMPPDVLQREAERLAMDPTRFRFQLEDMVLGKNLPPVEAEAQRGRMVESLLNENPDAFSAGLKLQLNPFQQVFDKPVKQVQPTEMDLLQMLQDLQRGLGKLPK